MKQKLITLVTALSLLVTPLVAVPAVAYAECPDSNTSKGQVLKGIGETGGDCSDTGVSNLTSSIVNILSIVVGIVAVIMVVVSGLKYVASGGDSNSVGSAKNTLIYALVGLAIAAIAQVLVHFVLSTVA